jgi:hypothetical protein
MNTSRRQFDIILCELHHPALHGKTDESWSDIENHYIVFGRYDFRNGYVLDDEESGEDDDSSSLFGSISSDYEYLTDYYGYYFTSHYPEIERRFVPHPSIRNFVQIVSRENYIKPEIAECIMLPTQERVAILKTVWLRLIQRTWKRVFKQRQHVILLRCHPKSLLFREVHGRWPSYCCLLPSIRGMLSNLVN